jgi:hypothetical protein
MRILYLIQTFKDLPQIIRLTKIIKRSDPSGIILISHNKDAFLLEQSYFEGIPDVHIINVDGGSRVDFSLTQSYISAIGYTKELGLDFDWVINVTGQCYPVRPLGELIELLENTQMDGFMDHHRVFDDQGRSVGMWPYQEAHGRYHYQYYWRFTLSEPPALWRKILGAVRVVCHKLQPWVRLDTGYALQIGLIDRSGIVGPSFPLFGGCYYMTLSRRAVDYLYDFTQANLRIVRHFSRMNIPSEVYHHTVLANNPSLRLSLDHHVLMDTAHNKRGRPFILTRRDLARIESSGAFFARKFDPSIDSVVLDDLDQRVLGLIDPWPTSDVSATVAMD